jgi:nucleotide-binding universal stress UspA family protein
MKTILVAIDGSDHARRALELAVDIASKYGGKLLLLHVLDNSLLSDAERRLAEAEYSDQIHKRMMNADLLDARSMGPRGSDPIFSYHAETGLIVRTALGEGLLSDAEMHAKENGVKDIVKLLEGGDPATMILKTAKKHNVNLIVVGSRGHSDIKALFMGSVSHKVSNLAEVNVITVK